MRQEDRVEVRSQREDRDRERRPRETIFAYRDNERESRDPERRQQEKAIKANSIFEPLQVSRDGLRAAAMEGTLRSILEFLLRRQRAMRRRIWLERECCRDTVLVPAQYVRQRQPTAGHLFVLRQDEQNGRRRRQRDYA